MFRRAIAVSTRPRPASIWATCSASSRSFTASGAVIRPSSWLVHLVSFPIVTQQAIVDEILHLTYRSARPRPCSAIRVARASSATYSATRRSWPTRKASSAVSRAYSPTTNAICGSATSACQSSSNTQNNTTLCQALMIYLSIYLLFCLLLFCKQNSEQYQVVRGQQRHSVHALVRQASANGRPFVAKTVESRVPTFPVFSCFFRFLHKNYIKYYRIETRLKSKEGINYTEFSYQVFQAYDWYHLFKNYGCSIQVSIRFLFVAFSFALFLSLD